MKNCFYPPQLKMVNICCFFDFQEATQTSKALNNPAKTIKNLRLQIMPNNENEYLCTEQNKMQSTAK